MNLNNTTVRIHSEIADRASAVKFWYYCRLLSNNGLSKINIKEVSKFFNVTVQTVRNWLSWCIKNKFVRNYSTDFKGNYKIFYSGLTKICNKIGAVANIDLKEKQNLKIIATQSLAQFLQNVAKFAAKSNYSKVKKEENPYARKVRDVSYLFELSPSELKAIGVLGSTNRYILVDYNFSHYGISYKTISDSLSRSESTVKRRLKDSLKMQIAQHKNQYYAEFRFAQEEFNNNRFIFAKVENQNFLFKALTNVYYPLLELTSMRYRKNSLKSKVL